MFTRRQDVLLGGRARRNAAEEITPETIRGWCVEALDGDLEARETLQQLWQGQPRTRDCDLLRAYVFYHAYSASDLHPRARGLTPEEQQAVAQEEMGKMTRVLDAATFGDGAQPFVDMQACARSLCTAACDLELLERIMWAARAWQQLHGLVDRVPALEAAAEAPGEEQGTAQEIVDWLPSVCAFCQSERVQQTCRKTFVELQVTPLDCEVAGAAAGAADAFSALCHVKNDQVNTIEELAQEQITNVVKQGPENFPTYYYLSAVYVFLEYVRCTFGKEFLVRTVHNARDETRAEGDILVHGPTELFFIPPESMKPGRRYQGPYTSAPQLLDAWMEAQPLGIVGVMQN